MVEIKSGARREKSQQTRRKILDAAKTEFVAAGYHGATITSIAGRAGVAAQTVYFVFHTKAELASAVIDDAVLGDAGTPPELSDWWAQMREASTAAESIETFVRGAAPLLERAALVSETVRWAAASDPEVRAVLVKHDGLQRIGYRRVVEVVATKVELREGLTVELATDVLLLLCGDGTYVRLRNDLGWSVNQIVSWLVVACIDALVGPTASSD